MNPRTTDILLILLLIIVTLSLAFQFQSHQVQRETLNWLRDQERRSPVVVVPQQPAITTAQNPPLAPATVTPAPVPTATTQQNPDPADRPDKPAKPVKPAPSDTANATTEAPETPSDITDAAHTPADDSGHVTPVAVRSTSILPPRPTGQPNPELWAEYGPTISDALSELLTGKYAQVAARFEGDLARNLPAAQLAVIADDIRKKHGNFAAVKDHSFKETVRTRQTTEHVFYVDVDTDAQQQLRFTVTIDDRKRITGLFLP